MDTAGVVEAAGIATWPPGFYEFPGCGGSGECPASEGDQVRLTGVREIRETIVGSVWSSNHPLLVLLHRKNTWGSVLAHHSTRGDILRYLYITIS